MTPVTFWVYMTLFFALCAGLGFWVYYEFFKYKHYLIIRELAHNRKFIIRERARDYVDSNKVPWWKLKREKDKVKKYVPIPPPEAIEVTKKGKKYVEAYRTEVGEYIFVIDDAKIMDVPDEVLDLIRDVPPEIMQISNEREREIAIHKRKSDILSNWRKDNNILKPLKPFSVNQRIALVTSTQKAEMRRKSDWKKDVPVYMALGGGILIIICFMIFGPDIINTYVKGSTQITSAMVSYEELRHKNLMEEQKNWESITQGIQTIYNVQQQQDVRLRNLENDGK